MAKNDLVMTAFDLWPAWDPRRTINSNSVQSGKLLRAQAENMDAATQLAELQKLDGQLRMAIAAVEQSVGIPDPLFAMAGITNANGAGVGATA